MKNIFLVLGLVLSVTLGASELFAQSNGRKKRDSKKTPLAKIESKRSGKSTDDSRRKKGRREEMQSRSNGGQHGHHDGQDSRQQKSDAPSRSGERIQKHANSRGHHGRTERDHGGQQRRGDADSNRRGDRPATGHRGHRRGAQGEHRGRPSSAHRDAEQRKGASDSFRERRGRNSDHPRPQGMERSRPEVGQRGSGDRSREMDRGPQNQRGGRGLKSFGHSPRDQGDASRGKLEREHRHKDGENMRGGGKARGSERNRRKK